MFLAFQKRSDGEAAITMMIQIETKPQIKGRFEVPQIKGRDEVTPNPKPSSKFPHRSSPLSHLKLSQTASNAQSFLTGFLKTNLSQNVASGVTPTYISTRNSRLLLKSKT